MSYRHCSEQDGGLIIKGRDETYGDYNYIEYKHLLHQIMDDPQTNIGTEDDVLYYTEKYIPLYNKHLKQMEERKVEQEFLSRPETTRYELMELDD